ncbi:hypothetical protein Afil01_44090 [Actinorhabdospora filicis]|uniref:Uncharacterized protein n=1 Tax=Actinorhabdospora filicis TaxID=1785913 RepID=A0A9W6SPA1_9ACTN|nr:hypothetical protein [Actinorhabdospora filicis]GLZ79602.1 hypothetical protein Afil01_44090 [Actinorhabdospora filicis]
MSLPMLAVSALTGLAALLLVGLAAVAVSAIHSLDLSVAQFCRCWTALLAERLDRHHGRHRLEDLQHDFLGSLS